MEFKEIARPEYVDWMMRFRSGIASVKILTGMRRVGKSYLLHKLFKEALLGAGVKPDHIIEVNLEDKELAHLLPDGALLAYTKSLLVDEQEHYILIDEAQMAEQFWWQLTTMRLDPRMNVYCTGSNSRFLTTDVQTEFRGRSDILEVKPLSYSNVNEYRKDIFPLYTWKYYLKYGGMPDLQRMETDNDRENFLKSLYNTAYKRDVIEHFKIEHEPAMYRLLQVIASQTGSLTSCRKLAATFRSYGDRFMTDQLLQSYLNYLLEAMLIEKVTRYDINGRRFINSLEKYYFVDHGLRNAVLDFRSRDEPHVFEAIVYNELRRQGYDVQIGVAQPRSPEGQPPSEAPGSGYEVDFVATRLGKCFYIQCAYAIPDEAKMEQEVRSFKAIDDFVKRVIITGEMLYEGTGYYPNGILAIPIVDFLTKPNMLDY